jgi:hypothetical protein
MRRLEVENTILRGAARHLRQRSHFAASIFETYVQQQLDRFTTAPTPATAVLAPSAVPAAPAHRPTIRQRRDEELLARIRQIYSASDGTYGARRIWSELRAAGVPVARCTVERLMRAANLSGRSGRCAASTPERE